MAPRLTPQQRVLRAMSEQQLADKTLELAGMAGWWWHHTRPAWTPKGFRTPLGGMVGFPDYVFARTTGIRQHLDGWQAIPQLLIVEFKTELGSYGPGQEEWARRLEPTGYYRLWRPSSWPEIERELTARA